MDPGHRYALPVHDGEIGEETERQYVKRVGDNFPGNSPPNVPGTIVQHELRAQIDRIKYVNSQHQFAENEAVIGLLESALLLLEIRAKRTRGETLDCASLAEVTDGQVCAKCGHIKCNKDHGP